MGLVDSIIGVESGGNPNATNPNSSASGLGQFIDSTWLSTIKQARPDLAEGKSDADLLALKSDPALSRQMTEAYANQNQAILSKAGVPVTPGSTYLAHFAGPGGAVKVLQADPNAPVESVLGEGVVKANPFLRGMTASALQAWADKKMGGSGPPVQTAQASPASPPSAHQSAPGAPVNIVPQVMTPPSPSAPIFAAPPQQQAPAAPPAFAKIPDMQAPPIFYAPRRPMNLASLQGAFRAPVFPRG
jgi:hypothetical protein